MHLVEAPWPAAAESDADVALLPVGSTEQHGPHAPLGTDFTAAGAAAQAGADAATEPVVIAPTIPVGVAVEHHRFAGTLWVSADTFRAYVRETIESLASHGWDRVVCVNGHGGNVEALREVCGDVSRSGEAYAVPFTWFEAVDDQVDHAGVVETSVIMHVAQGQVREDELASAAADAGDRWGEWFEGVNLAFSTDEFAENGVVGDPREASSEFGAELLAEAGESLGALIDHVASRDRDVD